MSIYTIHLQDILLKVYVCVCVCVCVCVSVSACVCVALSRYLSCETNCELCLVINLYSLDMFISQSDHNAHCDISTNFLFLY